MKHIWLAILFLLVIAGISLGQSNPASASSSITMPAGTHVLMKLVNPLHTVSASKDSAVYLEVMVPVIKDNVVAIPEHTRVMGTVLQAKRPGRVKGRAQLLLGFTNLIFPDDHVVAIQGRTQGLPNSKRDRRIDAEGTIEAVDQIDRDVKKVVVPAIPGAIVAVLGAGLPGARLALLGGGLGLGNALISRGDELALPSGTQVEMVLKHELQLDRQWVEQNQLTPKAPQPSATPIKTSGEEVPCDCFIY